MYKATYQFFYKIASSPEIHVVFKDSGNVLDVILGVDAGQNKGAVHHQHRKEHHLNNVNTCSDTVVPCLSFTT